MSAKSWINIIVIVGFLFGTGGVMPVAGQAFEEGVVIDNPPGWPLPAKPIPHNEPGHLSPANSYTTEAQRMDENGILQSIQLTGLDAMVEDGYDPLAGNYTMVDLDKLLRSSDLPDNAYGMETFALSGTVSLVPGSVNIYGSQRINDIAVGDLNADGTTEQIAAWLDADSTINISTGEMPGSIGKTTSGPAAVAAGFNTAEINLLVRGYDYALWHCLYTAGSCTWDSSGAGGVLLSAPAVVSQSIGQFDVYAILSNNLVYRRTRNETSWSASWVLVDDAAYWQPLEKLVPVPEVAAPAVIARSGYIDVFRLGPDNSLRWRHFNGSTWEAWENLGGSFASGPAALALSSSSMQVFARGMDDNLWTRKYDSGWGGWQRVKMTGMTEGVTINSAPAAVATTANQIDVYVSGSDYQLWSVHFNGSSWGDWLSAGGEVASQVGVALVGVEPYLFSQTRYDDLQVYPPGGGWASLNGVNPCCTVVDTGIIGSNVTVSDMHDFSIDLETGYIWGDGRSQMVMGYFSDPTHVVLSLFDISDSPGDKGFTPQLIAYIPVVNASYFRIATGDFLDRDGVDEIAIAYVNLDNDNLYTVEIYRFNRDMVNPALEMVTTKTVAIVGDANWYFSGTLEIAPGDLDLDGQDETALIMSWARAGHNGPGDCLGNDFHFRTRFFDVDHSDPDIYDLKEYYFADDWNTWADYDAWSQSVTGNITTGDADGDGQDEIYRNWPFYFNTDWHGCWIWENIPASNRFVRQIQSNKLPVNEDPNVNTWDGNGDGVIDRDPLWWTFGVPENTEYSYEERLVTGDFNRDLQDEIYWQIAVPNGDNRGVVYHYNGTSMDFFEYIGDGRHYMSRLVSGDFTGEGLRIGPPSVRIQQKMISPVVILNLPPMHRDIVNGEEIVTSNTAQAIHNTTNASNETSKSESKRDWALSTALETSIGGGGHKVTTSLSNTYGENFSNSTTAIAKRVMSATTTASQYDQVIFNSTDYKVWEYPVYGVQGSELVEAYTISVAFPLTSITTLPQPKSGQWCDESFYTPNHQINNVWSYNDIYNETEFKDMGVPIASQVTSGGSDLQLTMEEGQSYELSSGYKNQFSAGVEYSYENSLDIPIVGKAFEFSFKASVNGSYNSESMSTLTNEYVNTSSVQIGVPSDGTFDMGVYLYWAKANYLVVDYRTTPGSGGIWDMYNKPDPAFILPWYGFPDPVTGQFPISGPDKPPCGFDRQLFTHDVTLLPSYAEIGDTVTISATVRNFSAVTSGSNLTVRFYLGEPAGDNEVGSCMITGSDLARINGPQSCTADWVVDEGYGKEKIFAVIDPQNSLVEMHDETTVIDNNTGYGELYIARSDYLDPGLEIVQTYQSLEYHDEIGRGFGLYLPTANLDNTVRYELLPTSNPLSHLIGHPIQVLAYRGGQENPEQGHVFGAIPAVLSAFYRDVDLLPGMDEADLKLYRLETTGWVEATCPGSQIIRIPEDNFLSVPICEAGTFILTDEPLFSTLIPIILK